MTPLLVAVFMASLFGSLHCAGMCGAFLAIAVTADERPVPRPMLHGAYHLGRLATYTFLGALAGSLGAAIDLGGSLAGVQRAAAIFAGVITLSFGVIAILRIRGVGIGRLPLPRPLQLLVAGVHRAAAGLHPLARAAVIGLATTLLPCGWLYAFGATAAGSASPIAGATIMAVFWLGTLPVMVSVGVGLRELSGPLRRHVPLIAASLVVVAGAATIVARAGLIGRLGFEPVRPEAAIAHVNATRTAPLPCCNGD